MTYSPFSAAEHRDDADDESHAHAGDLVPALEPSPLVFGRGLVLGLVLSVIAWALLASAGYALYTIFVQ